MRRITQLGIAAVFAICLANSAPAAAEISLIGAWQHCEPVKGCLKFAFLPNGHVIEQFPLAGSVITAYGHYHIRGAMLKIGWHRFAPPKVCAAGADTNGSADRKCISSRQDDIKGPFHFEGINSMVWSAPNAPPLRLARIEL
jgi:hypothetical protein